MREPEVQLFQVEEWVFVLLPSEKKAFREQVCWFATPFEHMLGLRGPAYRLPADCRVSLLDLIIKHYPKWRVLEWQIPGWSHIPPWGQAEAVHFLPTVMDNAPTWEDIRVSERRRT